MRHPISTLATVATLSMGTCALAEEHVILILPDAYFPSITYVDPGDTVRFINVSATNQNIIAKNNKWTLGPIAPEGATTKVMDYGIQTEFYNADEIDEDGAYVVAGRVSFSAAPLN